MKDFKDFTLFLDRDGVINRRIVGDYVTNIPQFEFVEGVKESLAEMSKIFHPIVVVTNQQGIAKKLMTEEDLQRLHQYMTKEIERAGGKIDAVYYCPHLAETHCQCRKPNVGMALKMRKQFPSVNFKKSVMVGDSLSDMKFGKRLGMTTVFIGEDKKEINENAAIIDYCFKSLAEFAKTL